MIGKVVAHYRIIEKIGSGGMGEIYLAEDTKLERQVALKFLPRHLTEDREARTRFEREAKAAAALNHPNIITIHEIGEHEGQVFIAMEYIDGQTLKELIAVNRAPSTVSQSPSTPHPLPITQVLDIATQIAEGLSAAHEKGIIHRDIKPQNILVDKDGRVKILDFGLAKLKGASPLTQESFAMGTVHYMSPEQGLGREVDARTDIWSLGVVLYEMLAGRLPFLGDYDQAVIYAIVNEEMAPMPDAARKAFPGLANIIRRCLFK
jgi:serine/threonine protein kinase